jgi:hypothetical protein
MRFEASEQGRLRQSKSRVHPRLCCRVPRLRFAVDADTAHFSPAFRADFFDFERETGKNTHRRPQEKHANTPRSEQRV